MIFRVNILEFQLREGKNYALFLEEIPDDVLLLVTGGENGL